MNHKLFALLEIVVIAGLILLVMYWGGLFNSPPAPTPLPPTPVVGTATVAPQPTATPVMLTQPNGRIAFISDRDGNSEIYLVDIADARQSTGGSEQRNLTHHPAEDHLPAWSPNGRQIAFFSDRTGWPEIYVLDVEATLQGAGESALKQVTGAQDMNEHYEGQVAWSPDGSLIAAIRTADARVLNTDALYSLDLIRSNGAGTLTVYQDTAFSAFGPLWSPQGDYLVLTLQQAPQLATRVFPFESGTVGKPSVTLEGCNAIAWTPNGNQLLCSEAGVLTLVNPDGTGKVTLVDSFQDATSHLSPDGQYLLYTTGILTVEQDESFYEVHLIHFNASQKQTSLRLAQNVGTPNWASDSQWLVYGVLDQDDRNIAIVNIYDPAHPRQLTHDSGNNFAPRWQPVAHGP